MHLWLDTADVDEIRAAARFSVISGVTTNPSLWAKAAAGRWFLRREYNRGIHGPG